MRKMKISLVMTMAGLLALPMVMGQEVKGTEPADGIMTLLENEESARSYLALVQAGEVDEQLGDLKDSTVVVYSNAQLTDFRDNRQIDLSDSAIAEKLVLSNVIDGSITPESFPERGTALNLLGNEITLGKGDGDMIGSQKVEFLGAYFSKDGESLNYVYLVKDAIS